MDRADAAYRSETRLCREDDAKWPVPDARHMAQNWPTISHTPNAGVRAYQLDGARRKQEQAAATTTIPSRTALTVMGVAPGNRANSVTYSSASV